MIVRIRPIVVQPQTIVIAFNVEHVRVVVAIRVFYMARHPSHCPPNQKEVKLYIIWGQEPASALYQVFSFLDASCILRAKP